MNKPTYSELELQYQGSVLTIWLNRPETRNALSAAMVAELSDVMDQVHDDRNIRTIILRGKGGVFCAGGDIKGFKAALNHDAPNHEEIAKGNRVFGELMIKLNEQPQVVIVIVEGAAIGGGLGIACIGDVTLVTKEAKFRLSETSLGIPPAQIAPFITERVGLTQARRLMLTGAKFNGEDALQYGIAHLVAENNEDLNAMCEEVLQQISRCAPAANAMTKRIVFETLRKPRSQALDFAADGFASCMTSEEGIEGVTAFVEKRKPSWVGN